MERDVCGDPTAPVAPAIVSLGPRAQFVVQDELEVQVTSLIDAEGDPFESLELEIWTRNDDGTARERVWRAVVTDPSQRRVKLSDGTFEGLGAFLGSLEDWRDHLVRARYVVRPIGSCPSEGAWSDKLSFRTDDGSTAIYDQSIVRDYRIDLPPASVTALDSEAYPPNCVPYERNYYTGSFSDGTTTFTGAGVKIKGGCGSARDLTRKAALKVHLTWDDAAIAGCPATRRLKGIERFTFNNMVQDATMAHEMLAYALYDAMGVPVPRHSYARLTVNGQYFGLYLNVETVDRRFLARNFVSSQGALYEGTYFCDLVAGSVHDDDSGCLTRSFAPDPCDGAPDPGDDPLDYAPVRDLIARIDALPMTGMLPALAQFMDADEWLSMWAVDTVLAHWDGHLYNLRNNYRIYHDPATDLWTMIPSGVDQTMQLSHVNDTLLDPTARLGQKCLADAGCAAAYAAKVRQALDVMASLNMGSRRQALQDRIGTLVVPMAGREFDAARTATQHADTQRFIEQRPAIVLQALAARGL
ncbi:MAG TPA: CotH kinase family protein [Kofleriaceae bacterium]|nr:CotH kinase family protein [Kofleriaceae bacterium]